jgi:glycerol-3-phosphate dehydrogenase (NAD(P)+)
MWDTCTHAFRRYHPMTKIAILGSGSWGTALSIILSRSPRRHEVSLWARDPTLAAALARDGENKTYLPGCAFPKSVTISESFATALGDSTIVIIAVPSAHVRKVFAPAAEHLPPGAVIVSATKGLEPETHLRMSQVLTELTATDSPPQIAVLSGPSFAAEAARGEPTAVVVASQSAPLSARLQEEFAAPNFRLYTNDDLLGVELAGAMKNVIAIAAGACQGLGLGSNAVAALITRGLAEISRLASALGAKPETMSGLAGLGDLVLTCTGNLSRNRQVGFELGAGRSLPEILASMRMVAEGVGTTAPLLALAREQNIDLPITTQVDAILAHALPPREAIRAIMERPQKRES